MTILCLLCWMTFFAYLIANLMLTNALMAAVSVGGLFRTFFF